MRGKITILLILGLVFSLSPAQSENELPETFELVSASVSETEGLTPEISMDFQDANLKDVLKVFSQRAHLNFIASENIKDRKVTLYLDKVSVQDALNTIMSANNLTYEQERDSSIFIVKEWGKPEIETITRIYPLQYARVKGYALTESGEKKKETTKIGIKEVIEKILTQHGTIVEDSRTNSLIITDLPSQFPRIEQAVKELDIKLPQVMIEVEIIEASLETIDKLGIQWGDATDGYLMKVTGSGRTTNWPFGKGLVHGAFSGTAGSVNTSSYLHATLAMLAKDTDTKILARPRILTLNNETAEIRITADTAVSAGTTISSAGEGISQETMTVERYETGVTLLVTPQINKAGEITMAIEPSVSNVKASIITGDYYDPHTRSAKTTVTIRDKETVIIGGLINTEDERISRKVPFFGDIPIFGAAFRKKSDTSTDKEVIIFITPHLVQEGQRSAGLALEKQAPWEYERLGLKEEAMEKVLDTFEE